MPFPDGHDSRARLCPTRRVGAICRGLLAVGVALVLVIVWWRFSGHSSPIIDRPLLDQSERSGLTIPPVQADVDQISLSDTDGPWMDVFGVHVVLAAMDLLASTVTVQHAVIDRIVIHRWPRAGNDAGESADTHTQAQGVSAAVSANGIASALGDDDPNESHIARRIILAQAEVTELILLPEATGVATSMHATVAGMLIWDAGETATGRLTIDMHSPETARSVVTFALGDHGSLALVDAAIQAGPDRLRVRASLDAGRSLTGELDVCIDRLNAQIYGVADLGKPIPELNATGHVQMFETAMDQRDCDTWFSDDRPIPEQSALLNDPDEQAQAQVSAGQRGGRLAAWLDGWLPEGAGVVHLLARTDEDGQSLAGEMHLGPMGFDKFRFDHLTATVAMTDVFGPSPTMSINADLQNASSSNWVVRQSSLRLGGTLDPAPDPGTMPQTIDGATLNTWDHLRMAWDRWQTAVVQVDLQVSMDGTFLDRAFDVEGRGRLTGHLSIEGEQHLIIESVDATVVDLEISLRTPLDLRRTPDRMALKPFLIRAGPAQFAGGGWMTEDALRVRFDWDMPSMSWIPGAWQRGFDAALQGELALTGDLAQPDVACRLALSNVVFDTRPAGLPWVDRLDARLSTVPQGLSLHASLLGMQTNLMTLQTVFPKVVQLQPVLALVAAPESTFHGHLTGSVPLAWVGDVWLPDDTRRIDGLATLTLRWDDHGEGLALSGEAVVRDGSYRDLLTGTRLRDIQIVVRGDDDGLVIDQGRARDRGEGVMTLEGRADIRPWGQWPHDIHLNLSRMRLVERDDITAIVDGSLRLAGNLDASELQGGLTLAPVEIRLPERLPAMISTIPVIDPDAPPTSTDERTALFPRVALAVTIDVPQRLFVRNRTVDTEWQGTLDVGGTLASPEIQGVLNAVHGRFMVLGRRFRLQQGSIRFPGFPVVPFFDATAETDAGGIVARLRLSGTPSYAQWELSSIPELPEDEILTRVFFNRAVGSPTAGQALRVAQAAEALAGGGQLTDVLEFGRRALRVDRIDFVEGQTPDEAARFSVGKYVGDRGFVDLEKDVARSEGARARVSYDLAPGISLETEVETAGERGIGLRWQWDY